MIVGDDDGPPTRPVEVPQLPLTRSLRGLPASPGVAVGRVVVFDRRSVPIARRAIEAAEVRVEVSRLHDAITHSRTHLEALRDRLDPSIDAEHRLVLEAHLLMVKDELLVTSTETEIRAGKCAEWALRQVADELVRRLQTAKESYLRERAHDIEHVVEDVLRALTGAGTDLPALEDASVLVASDLSAAELLALPRGRLLALVTELGTPTGHTAILARALHVPAVVGVRGATRSIEAGSVVIVDARRGEVQVDPSIEARASAEDRVDRYRSFSGRLRESRDAHTALADGTRIEILANLEIEVELDEALDERAEGIGLYRTEFLYLTSKTEPSEEDHYKSYLRCVELMKGKPLTIRTMDLGADKYTQERAELPERNPFLGCRSIRYCLKNQPMFKRQLRALLRASAKGPIKIMFPLVTSTGEFRQAKYLVNDVMEDLDEEGIKFDRNLKVGMMVEVPSAAIMADTFAREVDFFSIGTNDLTQYTLAVDRSNESIASMYNPAHPAVIRLIRDVSRAARRHDTPVSCCGEAAGDVEYALLLVGMGLRTLSVSAGSIPQLKRLIRSVSLKQCEQIARQALSFDSETQVSSYLRDRARKIVPDLFDGRTGE